MSSDSSVDPRYPHHPRPQLKRAQWVNLNGSWDYALTPLPDRLDAADPLAVADPTDTPSVWDGVIEVPYSPEFPLSGVERTLTGDETLWYRRTFRLEPGPGERVILHLDAVDQSCRIGVNGVDVCYHTGGYLPVNVDITEALTQSRDGVHELVVAVRDVTDESWLTRGKQSSRRGGIWYTPQSGMWQSVWLEVVPDAHIERALFTPDFEGGAVTVELDAAGAMPGQTARVTVFEPGLYDGSDEQLEDPTEATRPLVEVEVPIGIAHSITLPKTEPWSPEAPYLYPVHVQMGQDHVKSYFGMRSFGVGQRADGRSALLLNGRPYMHVGLLDQGYWPEGGYTAPSDEALEYDVALAKSMGYNMLRKHIKVEPMRWYYHCDRLGMLVWQDAVNGGGKYSKAVTQVPAVVPVKMSDDKYRIFARDNAEGRASFENELKEMIEHLRGVVSIALWVPFNEGWGQFDAARIAEKVSEWDPTRPIDHASGWYDQGAGDLLSHHVYFSKYKVPDKWQEDGRVIALTEYGGYAWAVPEHYWGDNEFGYRRYKTGEELKDAFVNLHMESLVPAVKRGLGAIVYTQLSDVEDEVNGLVTYDREVVKIPEDTVRLVNDALRETFDTVGAQPWLVETDQTREGDLPVPQSQPATTVIERELTEPVALVDGQGKLNPAAVGWARSALVNTSGVDGKFGVGSVGSRGWLRNKRWEYWNVITPTHIIALTVSSIDYAAVNELWVFDRSTGKEYGQAFTSPAPASVLPPTLGDGRAVAQGNGYLISIDTEGDQIRLRGRLSEDDQELFAFDIDVRRPENHDFLGVVVPWNQYRFQYTVKDIALPATGWLRVDGTRYDVPQGSWAVLDHGRGRWPHNVRWNWGAGSGVSGDHTIGIQVGGQWTDGTGVTENGMIVDGHLYKISEYLKWEYDLEDETKPWKVSGGGLNASLQPFHVKKGSTNLVVLSNRTDQAFGIWSGTFTHPDLPGGKISFENIAGWAEDVHNRW